MIHKMEQKCHYTFDLLNNVQVITLNSAIIWMSNAIYRPTHAVRIHITYVCIHLCLHTRYIYVLTYTNNHILTVC